MKRARKSPFADFSAFKPGAKVRASYGRLDRATGVEHVGEVLAVDDVRAWLGSLAFPVEATQAQVTSHVQAVKTALVGVVPVLWSFGKVYWEKISSLETV